VKVANTEHPKPKRHRFTVPPAVASSNYMIHFRRFFLKVGCLEGFSQYFIFFAGRNSDVGQGTGEIMFFRVQRSLFRV
jgi:hypothetical protein